MSFETSVLLGLAALAVAQILALVINLKDREGIEERIHLRFDAVQNRLTPKMHLRQNPFEKKENQ